MLAAVVAAVRRVVGIAGLKAVDKGRVTFQVVVAGRLRIHQRREGELFHKQRGGRLRNFAPLFIESHLLLLRKIRRRLSQKSILRFLKQVEPRRLGALVLRCVDVELFVGSPKMVLAFDNSVHFPQREKHSGCELLLVLTVNPFFDHCHLLWLEDTHKVKLRKLLLFNDLKSFFFFGPLAVLAVVAGFKVHLSEVIFSGLFIVHKADLRVPLPSKPFFAFQIKNRFQNSESLFVLLG